MHNASSTANRILMRGRVVCRLSSNTNNYWEEEVSAFTTENARRRSFFFVAAGGAPPLLLRRRRDGRPPPSSSSSARRRPKRKVVDDTRATQYAARYTRKRGHRQRGEKSTPIFLSGPRAGRALCLGVRRPGWSQESRTRSP